MWPFTSNVKLGTQVAVAALRPIIGSIQHLSGLPPRFWTDPYIVGFTCFVISFQAKRATNGKVAGEAMGQVLTESYAALSNLNGLEIANSTVRLAGNPRFEKGLDDAALLSFFTYRILKNEDENPFVMEARALAAKAGSSSREAIAAMLLAITFLREVREQFG